MNKRAVSRKGFSIRDFRFAVGELRDGFEVFRKGQSALSDRDDVARSQGRHFGNSLLFNQSSVAAAEVSQEPLVVFENDFAMYSAARFVVQNDLVGPRTAYTGAQFRAHANDVAPRRSVPAEKKCVVRNKLNGRRFRHKQLDEDGL